MLLVREAGGYVSDLAGGRAMMANGDVLAANDHLHLPLAALLREAQRSGRAAAATSSDRGPPSFKQ
jgi:myo-inositol-1(or 4)-monophosphatase